MLPLIFGCSSTRLQRAERAFFAEYPPAGFILFARNIRTPRQTRELVAELREVSRATNQRDHTAILLDQEGGVVQRLRPPHWRGFPSAKSFGDFWHSHGRRAALRVCRSSARLMGEELASLGITVACAPVADLLTSDADLFMGSRSFGQSVERVSALARAQAEGLLDAGILPIVKHVPGHGRARCDSHKTLPYVEQKREELLVSDFACFAALNDFPAMMTAHVCYRAFDTTLPATISAKTLSDAVRRDIGFKGLLISDDLRMQALRGNMVSRTLDALRAGCDLALYCGSQLRTMRALSDACLQLSPQAHTTTEASLNSALAYAMRRRKSFSQYAQNRAVSSLVELQSCIHRGADSAMLDPTA